MKRWTFATIAMFFILLPWREALRADQVQYTVEDLGTIDGLVPTITGMNASGQMSGFVTLPGSSETPVTRAVRYTNGLGWTYLPGLEAGSLSKANGINALGDLTGYHVTEMGQVAYRYSDGVGVVDIAPPFGGLFVEGFAINGSGDVVGWGMDSSFAIVALRASSGLPAQVLPSLGGAFPATIGCGINEAGQVAATALSPDFLQTRGVRIDVDGTVTAVEPFNGAAGVSTACEIDSDGRLAGQATVTTGVSHASQFSAGALSDLDGFASSFSNIEAVSEGVSVGWYRRGDASTRAFVHTEAAGSRELTALVAPEDGWVLTEAQAVNALGQIAGQGTLNNVRRAFRLTPVKTADTTAPVIDRVAATPSLIALPNGEMVPVTVLVSATDDVDAAPSCSITGIAGRGAVDGDSAITGPLSALVRAVPGRTYVLSVACSDAAGNTTPASATVEVAADTTAPVIGLLVATPSRIWPPNGRMVDVELTAVATDDVDPAPSCTLTSVRGTLTGDAEITGPLSARVRARKNNDGSERSYLLTVTCTDAAGNSARRSVSVRVAKGDGDSDYYARAMLRTLYELRHDLRHDRDGDGDDDHGRSGHGRGRR